MLDHTDIAIGWRVGLVIGCLTVTVMLAGCTDPTEMPSPSGDPAATPSPGPEEVGPAPADPPPPPQNVTIGHYVLEWGVKTTLTFPLEEEAIRLHATIRANVSADGPYAMANAVRDDGPVLVVRRPGFEYGDPPEIHWVFENDLGTGTAGETLQGPFEGSVDDPETGDWTFQTEGGTGRNIRFELVVIATVPGEAEAGT